MKAALVLSVMSPLMAQAPSTPDTAAPPAFAATGAYFALSVADLAASTRWYVEKLGLRVVMQLPGQNKTAVTVLEGGGLIVELIQHEDARPLSVVAPGTRDPLLVHSVFKVGVIVRDNAGNLIQLFAR
jgi:catechol-2,3-dioxygenase